MPGLYFTQSRYFLIPTPHIMVKDKLFSKSYLCILAAKFLLFFGFWILIPVLPFYIKETYSCQEAVLGAVLSCYTIS